MHRNHDIFMKALQNKKKVILTLCNKTSKSERTHNCGPFFYLPSPKNEDSARYYVWDFDDDGGKHLLGLPPSEIVRIQIGEESFDPAGFVISDIHSERM